MTIHITTREVAKDLPADSLGGKLRALVNRMEGDVRRAFVAAVERIRGSIDLEEFAARLLEGHVDDALDMVDRAIAGGGLNPFIDSIRAAIIAGGELAALAARVPNVIEARFDVLNPGTAAFIRQYEFDKIRELTTSTRAAVRDAVTTGVLAGRNPIDTAREVRAVIGLTARQEAAVANFRRMLMAGDAEALTRALRDRRFDSTVRAVIRGTKVLASEKVDRIVQRYREKSLLYRSQMIARTESIRAVNAGQYQLWAQLREAGLVADDEIGKLWFYTHDARVRNAHRTIPGLNAAGVVGLDTAFASILGPIRYPGDPLASGENTIHCRCAMMIQYRPRVGSNSARRT